MHCGTTVGVHGRLSPYPWLDDVRDDQFREQVLDLALSRADAYGWQAPYGWRTPGGRKLFPVPDRWFDCEKGGDWSGEDEVRELAWIRADIPEEPRRPRLPVLPMTRTLVDALGRVGEMTFTALRACLPLQIIAGEAEGDLDDMRGWFSLADPSASADIRVTVSAGPSAAWDSPNEDARVRRAVRERLGGAAGVDSAPKGDAACAAARGEGRPLLEGARPVVRFACRAREWSPDVAVWLIEATGDALRATGHATPAVVTAFRAP